MGDSPEMVADSRSFFFEEIGFSVMDCEGGRLLGNLLRSDEEEDVLEDFCTELTLGGTVGSAVSCIFRFFDLVWDVISDGFCCEVVT